MNSNPSQSLSKTSAAVVAGVGVAAGAAVLQSASAKVAPETVQALSPNADAPVASDKSAVVVEPPLAHVHVNAEVGAAEIVAPAQSIEKLVDAYLEEGDLDALSVEALSDVDLQEHLPEPELLQALISQPGYQVAQAGGGGVEAGGGLTGFQMAGIIGGGVAGAYGLNELLDDDNDVASSAA